MAESISLIVATRNRAAMACDTARRLLEACAAGRDAEILFVDNGSTDDTAARLSLLAKENPRLRLLFQRTGGKAAALNQALRQASGDVLVFCDDDVRPDTGWLDSLTAPLFAGKADAVAGAVRLAPHLERPWMGQIHRSALAETSYLNQDNPETAVGANMAMTRLVLTKVPAFDEELGPGALGLWEDTLFSMQMRQAGYRLAMAADARVEHHFEPQRLTRAAFVKRALSEARSSAYVAWHWRHECDTESALTIAEYRLKLLVKRLLHGDFPAAGEGIPEWYLNLLMGIEYSRHLKMLRGQPRNYELRGLVKRSQPSIASAA